MVEEYKNYSYFDRCSYCEYNWCYCRLNKNFKFFGSEYLKYKCVEGQFLQKIYKGE